MATAPVLATELAAAASVSRIHLADIDAGERLRPVDADWAVALAAIIARDGQLTPIEVCQLPGQRGYRLVTGAHRLAALAYNGATHALAIMVSADRAERRLREVSENLWRRGLAPLDRAAFVAELAELTKAKLGVAEVPRHKLGARARWGDANAKAAKAEGSDAWETISQAYSWADEVAGVLGVTRRTVSSDLLLHRGIAPDLRDALRPLPDGGKAAVLRRLAVLPFAEQRAVVRTIALGQATTLGEALAATSGKPKPTRALKLHSTLRSTLQRMSAAERAGAFQWMANVYGAEIVAACRRDGEAASC